MSRKDNKNYRSYLKNDDSILSFFSEPNLATEKNKARELRNSSWWKKKIASGKCYYCGGNFKPNELTMDHLVPLARGGKSEKMNLVPACKECNNKKKYLLPSEWEDYIKKLTNLENDKEK